jgi:hypothetical protein
LPQDFSYYETFFNLVRGHEDLKKEFDKYMAEDTQDLNLNKLVYWKSRRVFYPILAKLALNILCTSYGSLDAERSFSKFRDVLTTKRTRLTQNSLKIKAILYFNSDIEGYFL